MKIKTRLKLSYGVMIILPLITIILTQYISLFKLRELSLLHFYYTNPKIENALLQLAVIAENQPEQLENKLIVRSMEHRLKLGPSSASLVIRKNRKLIYVTPAMENKSIINKLQRNPAIKFTYPLTQRNKLIQDDGKIYIALYHVFRCKDGQPGSITLLSDITQVHRMYIIYFVVLILLFLISVYMAGSFLTLFVARSIIKPLKELEDAARKIGQGALEFKLHSRAKDEFGELMNAFETMRVLLKDSLESQLREDNEQIQFVSGLSHDLRTPITSIKGYIEGIQVGIADHPEKMKNYLLTVEAKVNYLEQLLETLKLFSDIGDKGYLFQYENLDLSAFLTDYLTVLTPELKASGTELHLMNIPETAMVRADRRMLHSVIENIIGNALKYKDDKKPKSTLDIRVHEDELSFTVLISDNGTGIPQDALPHIFEAYYRADQQNREKREGTGLGLTITKLILEEMGGAIWVESEYGQKTTVGFSLPKSIPA